MYPYSCEVCATVLKLTDQHLGRKIRCPRCRSVLEIPEFPSQLAPQSTPLASSRETDSFSPGGRAEQSSEFSPQPPAPEKAGQPFEYNSKFPEEAGQPFEYNSKFPELPTEGGQPSETPGGKVRGVNWASVLVGVGMMLLASIWFVGGLLIGQIFFYPAILLIFGLLTSIKGLFGYE